jgi:hypothetical protein
MKFEVSESINGCDSEFVLSLLETQLRKVSGQVARDGRSVTAQQIEASFGSINRQSAAICSARGNGSRGILTAEVEYKPSLAFWIFLILGLFTLVGWLIPLAFYTIQKSTVRSAIEAVFRRVKTECEFNEFSPVASQVAFTSPTTQSQIGREASPSIAVASEQSTTLDPVIRDSYRVLGLQVGVDDKTAEATYARLAGENDPEHLKSLSNELQNLAKSKTVDIRVAYTFVSAHIASKG